MARSQRESQSLNATALELLECALDAWDEVEVEEEDASAK
jgi:hypothetical protein